MAYKIIYLIVLLLITNESLCFPNRKPRSTAYPCSLPFLTGCLGLFKPVIELNKSFLPVLNNISLKRKDESIESESKFPPIFINPDKNDHTTEDEKKNSSLKLNTEKLSPQKSNNKEMIAVPREQKPIVDFNVTETSTKNPINIEMNTVNTDDNDIITTTEEQEATTEDLTFRLSELSPAVLGTLLG